MPRARSLAVLLVATTLSAPAAAFAQGSGGAGDNQYQDPFSGKGGGSSTTTGSSGSSSSSATSSQSGALSQTPNLGSSSSTVPAPATAPASTTASGTLPNTGSDPRLIVLAGLALLLFGIGLRLRTADERF
jgi:LPXTG-motif cell wall-anchored protein